jgi:hypothetical protein
VGVLVRWRKEKRDGDGLLVALLVDATPFCVVEGSDHDAHVDEVLEFVPGPFFGDVVDFQDAVWGHPCYWWWEEVDSADGGWVFLCVNMLIMEVD